MSLDIRFYNSLTHRTEPFEPIEPGRVSMYNCGPTVYDFAHIGNFRAFLFADLLRRFLELAGHEVTQVMNLTDVGHMTDDAVADGAGEDKMEQAQRRLKEMKKAGELPPDAAVNADDPYAVAQFYIDAFVADARALGLKIADEYPDRMPRATQHVPQMTRMVERLIEAGHAYVASDHAVYYAVESFPDYGRLSGNTLDQLQGGAGGRVHVEHQAVKRHPADFLLWKPDPSHLMRWDSPWGEGYPGWHIECSAMATHVLGREVIDIHTGGEDNIFPHHECEIAQTRGATGQKSFANYWMHTRFLLVEGEKMSKRLGNFFTVRDGLEGRITGRPIDPSVLRYELLRSHYRQNMNFTVKGLEDSAKAVGRLRSLRDRLRDQAGGQIPQVDLDHPMVSAFAEALADDLNISGALGAVFAWASEAHADPAASLGALRVVDRVLDVLEPHVRPAEPAGDELDVKALCRRIDEARAAKDYAAADAARDQLTQAGYVVQITREGASAKPRLA